MSVQDAICTLIAIFQKYAEQGGDKYKLSKEELKELLNAEMGDMIGNVNDPKVIDKVMADMDTNADNSVDFKEFMTMIACVTMICHEFWVDCK
ncbi:hypothetical protein CRUP_002143 [Coryphaenoides rupestris]|nr:hypothetical protein CRUP_002143 [Coryphaenoides rupestris]